METQKYYILWFIAVEIIIFLFDKVATLLITETTAVQSPTKVTTEMPLPLHNKQTIATTPSLEMCLNCNELKLNDSNCSACNDVADTTSKEDKLSPDTSPDLLSCTYWQDVCIQHCSTAILKNTTTYIAKYEIQKCKNDCKEHWYCPLEKYDKYVKNRRILGRRSFQSLND